ncbi:MAG: GNAT family N-acetyltransferase [Acidimicrobiales bacterium]
MALVASAHRRRRLNGIVSTGSPERRAPVRKGGRRVISGEGGQVVDNTEASRYEILVGGTVAGFAAYRRGAREVVLTHTEVSPAFGGRGIGSRLAQRAFEDARGRALRVVAACSFMEAYARRHPEHGDLLAGSAPAGEATPGGGETTRR